MSTKRFYWLKLKEDFFQQKEIKKLRKIAGGDTYTVIYLKMLLRSLKDNGRLYYEGVESDFPAELALDIDEDEDNVKIVVSFLIANNILTQTQADEYELLTAHEMTGSECDSAQRVRRLRAQKALEGGPKTLQCNATVTASNAIVTHGNTDIDIDIDIDKEKREKKLSAAADSMLEDFSRFWAVYPRKVSKQPALKAWKTQKINRKLTDVIIADVKRRKATEWKGTEIQFIPHPATYLNQRRWEDETQPEARKERAVEKGNPALDYEQRDYTENDYSDYFLDLDNLGDYRV